MVPEAPSAAVSSPPPINLPDINTRGTVVAPVKACSDENAYPKETTSLLRK